MKTEAYSRQSLGNWLRDRGDHVSLLALWLDAWGPLLPLEMYFLGVPEACRRISYQLHVRLAVVSRQLVYMKQSLRNRMSPGDLEVFTINLLVGKPGLFSHISDT